MEIGNLPFSPHNLLPVNKPLDDAPDENFFYENVVKHLVPDVLRIMNNGIPIDLEKVKKLKVVVTNVLEENRLKLKSNPIICEYMEKRRETLLDEKFKEQKDKFKKPEDYLVPFDAKKSEHKSNLINYLLRQKGLDQYVLDKWTVKDLKTLGSIVKDSFIQNILDKNFEPLNLSIQKAMAELAETKARLYNEARLKPVSTFKESLKDLEFNTSSHVQKNELFEMLGIDTLNYTPTGARKIDRDELERLNTEVSILLNGSEREDLAQFKEVLETFINNSNAKIISSSFIPAFERFSINGVLYGNIKIFGTKTFRPTCNSPNLLQIPSTGNVFAKPVKECLIAPEGYLVYAVDLNALEDVTMANLSLDENKITILTDPELDGHCMASYYYVPNKIEAILPKEPNEDNISFVKRYSKAVHDGNKELKKIRQDLKSCTFGLSYGAYPPKIATTLQCSIDEATAIFDNYHYKLYPKITEFREYEVLPKALEDGRIHLGLGCYLYTDNPEKDIRTLNNATCQFWSILTLLAINKIHHMIDAMDYQDDIKVICTIYDSIYFIVKEDAEIIKWLNDNIVTLLTKDWLVDQTVPNSCEGECGTDWSNLKGIPNNATVEQIQEVLQVVKENK